MLGIKILLKLGLSGPSVIVPSDIIAAYLFYQLGERMFYETNSTTYYRILFPSKRLIF
jgi:hypothetical protein